MPDLNNSLTLQTYQNNMQAYIDATPLQINDAEGQWLDQMLGLIAKDANILELGSGFGRNASYITKQGYRIERTDAVPAFIELLQSKGFTTRFLDALKDDFGSQRDMILANGVLIHFTPPETAGVLAKVFAALKPGGIFAFSVKQGEGGVWTDEKLGAPRFFQYWQPEDLKKLTAVHGFEWLTMLEGRTSLRNASWLYVILRKVTT